MKITIDLPIGNAYHLSWLCMNGRWMSADELIGNLLAAAFHEETKKAKESKVQEPK